MNPQSRRDRDSPKDSAFTDQVQAARRNRELIAQLAQWRAKNGPSQAETAKRMHTSQPAVARLESHQHDAQLSTLARYVAAIGLSLHFVLEDSKAGTPIWASVAEGPRLIDSAMPPSELSGIAVEDLFAGVTSPDHTLTVRAEISHHSDSGTELSPLQSKILAIISDSSGRLGRPPSRKEIGREAGLRSMSSVSEELAALERMGYLRTDTVEEIMRQEAAYVPLVGQIAAGIPVLAREDIEDVIQLPKQIVGEGELFLLRVTGDSMIGAAIVDGDLVVVRQQPLAENGEIVAAMVDGEATIKTLRRANDGHIWLQPHNPMYEPIRGDDATILGLVVAVMRRLNR
jgi:repressor LexA